MLSEITIPRGLVLTTLALASSALAQIPAFPGAEGFGGYAKGGRGGDVYTVTNLNASGAGSFRNGIETVPAGGRTIVFAVSGHIHINGLRLTASNVTIAGQTAPGDGVGLVDGTFRISGDDVVVRHLRMRHRASGSGGDCLNLDSGSINSVIDSVSMQFSTDENFSSFGSPPENLTMQWSLNGWGLESHSCGGLWDQNHATCHHSLWSHNHTRNPKARPNGLLEWVNNVTFDWDIGFIMGDSETPAAWKANVRGCYFLCPASNLRSRALEKANLDRNGNPNFSLYLDNCRHDNNGNGVLDGTDKGYAIASGNYTTLTSPVAATGAVPVTLDDPAVAFKKVVSKAGALRLDLDPAKPLRDEVDARMVQNLVSQTANHVSNESQLGLTNGGIGTLASAPAPIDTDRDGMPDPYETALGWNPAAQDHNTALANSGGLVTGTTFLPPNTPAGAGALDKYTRLEEYLHFLSIPHGTVAKNTAAAPTSIQTDLRKFTSGFSASPVFAVSNISGGTVVQSGPGNCLITFTPTLNHVGRARFDFTVTDAAGHSWTQTCAILVTAAGIPRDLKWKGGAASNIWDAATPNWTDNGAVTAFSTGDRVFLDDTGSQSPAVNVSGTVSPGGILCDAVGNYTLTGGAVTSTGSLVKRGSGMLTFTTAGPNAFTSVALESGTLKVNSNALGTGPLDLIGGTLDIGANATTNSALNILGPVVITGGSGGGATGIGPITGSAPLTISQTNVFDLRGDMSGYSGTVTFTGNAAIRMNGSIGSGAATFVLNGNTWLNKRSSVATITLGGLGGAAGGTLAGSTGNTSATTYQIGDNGASTVFAGRITNGGGTTSIVKTGAGTITLSGTSDHTGTTAVNQGAVLVDGALGSTAVTVASGAMLGGDGTIGGPVTVNSGAYLSPGTIPFTGATLAVGGNLALNSNILFIDLSNSPAGQNDRITVGGTLALTGSLDFRFLLLNGPLSAGTYDLVAATNSSASGVSLLHNLPSGTRQSFALGRSAAGSNPSKIWLTVTGSPATLSWTGLGGGLWDTVSTGNWTGATPATFYQNDAVVFNDSAATRTVALSDAVSPRSAIADTALGFTFSGAGALAGTGVLTKNGSGNLTLSNTGANSFSGGTILNAGGIVLADATANSTGLGTGPLTFNGGTLTMAGFNGSNSDSYPPMPNALVVPAGATGTLNLTQRAPKPGAANVFPALTGTLSGGGTLNLMVKFVRGDVLGDWSAFGGTLKVLPADADGGDFRFGTSYAWAGMPAATVDLGDKTTGYYVGTSSGGAGTTVGFGELTGTASSRLLGGTTAGRNFAYRIGGKTPAGSVATFAGTIGEQSSGVTTTFVKTGAGIWSLSGSGSWNGGTLVEQGTLRMSGTFACAGATQVGTGATLELRGGSLATDNVQIAQGGTLLGAGVLTSDLDLDGTLECQGYAGTPPGTLRVTGSAFLGDSALVRMRAGLLSDRVEITGDLALGGTLAVDLTTGTGFGRYPLFTFTGNLSGGMSLTGIPVGTQAHLSTSRAGSVDLVVDDSDEDGLPDTWEQARFRNLTQGPAGDPDGDGTTNLAEWRLNLNPANSSSAFRATCNGRTLVWPSAAGIVFTIRRSLSLGLGGWQTIGTVTGGPGATATFTDPASFSRAFYRIEFTP
ncbi:MAG: autotransporter-associated beta strand repeat-containing protein [Verrucomicrobia bacterium]|nr:autotransporter-associated beta strand repeat-containing protein [Verrucomicrobiota bacterium]